MEDINITNFEGVYEPAEDSWLMSKHIPNFEGNVLEVGSGTGIISIHLARRGHQVTAVDLNPKAVQATKLMECRIPQPVQVVQNHLIQEI